MLKNILKLKGAQKLTKNEQKLIKGGRILYLDESPCYKCCWPNSNECTHITTDNNGDASCGVPGYELRPC